MKIWATLKHDNILPFYGACTQFGSLPAMVSPWLESGCLNRYLREHGEDGFLTETLRLKLVSDSPLFYRNATVANGSL